MQGVGTGDEMGEGGQTALLVNKMARLTSEGNWAEASAAAAEVVAALGNDKTNQNYVAARFVQVAAVYVCPAAEPEVAPQMVQVFGLVQVAAE